ncbi:NADH:ubiquinone oxidoreductase intermediate-associated protein 30 [Rhodotorula toruloides]|uniref:NADH:ubiquinone oxidoreductase intermediate-associated protein 30 n=1 Tax=Rhodotorula toruloides TaxID=5286 RepID=A0A511KND0_RHOTO|nr:NADH:ubiquinone oxidoreductase intermediate-associated protein 30 [Rhodotorula toruloides]
MTRNRFIIGGPAPWPAFTAVNDSIRGGSSTSSFTVDPETNVATFAGHLDYTTLGGAGFASQSTTFEPTRLSLPRSNTSGLFLTFLPPLSPPSPKTPTHFTLNIKDKRPERRPDGRRESVTVYEYELDVEDYRDNGLFDEKEEGDLEKGERRARRSVTVLAKWEEFKPFYRGKPKEDAATLDPSAIYELSFMCRSNFGQQQGDFTLDIVSLSAAPAHSTGNTWFRSVAETVSGWWIRLVGAVLGLFGRESRDGSVRLV